MLYEDNTELITLQAKDLINSLLHKFQEGGSLDKIEQFFEQVGPQANLYFRGHIWIKATMIKCDPKAYFKMIKAEEENYKRWMVNTEVLTEAVSMNPDIEDKLIKLADENFMPAAVLATKLALAQGKFERFDKYIELVPKQLLVAKKAGLFDRIDTVEKMNYCMDTISRLGMDPAILTTIANCCLAISSKVDVDTFVNATDNALAKGIKLRSLPPTFLVRLANAKNFQYQQEARDLVHNKAAACQ